MLNRPIEKNPFEYADANELAQSCTAQINEMMKVKGGNPILSDIGLVVTFYHIVEKKWGTLNEVDERQIDKIYTQWIKSQPYTLIHSEFLDWHGLFTEVFAYMSKRKKTTDISPRDEKEKEKLLDHTPIGPQYLSPNTVNIIRQGFTSYTSTLFDGERYAYHISPDKFLEHARAKFKEEGRLPSLLELCLATETNQIKDINPEEVAARIRSILEEGNLRDVANYEDEVECLTKVLKIVSPAKYHISHNSLMTTIGSGKAKRKANCVGRALAIASVLELVRKNNYWYSIGCFAFEQFSDHIRVVFFPRYGTTPLVMEGRKPTPYTNTGKKSVFMSIVDYKFKMMGLKYRSYVGIHEFEKDYVLNAKNFNLPPIVSYSVGEVIENKESGIPIEQTASPISPKRSVVVRNVVKGVRELLDKRVINSSHDTIDLIQTVLNEKSELKKVKIDHYADYSHLLSLFATYSPFTGAQLKRICAGLMAFFVAYGGTKIAMKAGDDNFTLESVAQDMQNDVVQTVGLVRDGVEAVYNLLMNSHISGVGMVKKEGHNELVEMKSGVELEAEKWYGLSDYIFSDAVKSEDIKEGEIMRIDINLGEKVEKISPDLFLYFFDKVINERYKVKNKPLDKSDSQVEDMHFGKAKKIKIKFNKPTGVNEGGRMEHLPEISPQLARSLYVALIMNLDKVPHELVSDIMMKHSRILQFYDKEINFLSESENEEYESYFSRINPNPQTKLDLAYAISKSGNNPLFSWREDDDIASPIPNFSLIQKFLDHYNISVRDYMSEE